jgi:hypothetical protein
MAYIVLKPTKTNSAHVLHDLQPYICTYPNCATASRLYASRKSWLEHERVVRRQIWQCHDHPTGVFVSKEAFQKHLNNDHDNLTEIHAQQIASFAEATVSDERMRCPFCLNPGPFSNGLHNHMAYHQEHIAVFSLPIDTQGSNDDDSKSSKAQGHRSEDPLGSVHLAFDEDPNSVTSSNEVDNMENIPGTDLTLTPDTASNLHDHY